MNNNNNNYINQINGWNQIVNKWVELNIKKKQKKQKMILNL